MRQLKNFRMYLLGKGDHMDQHFIRRQVSLSTSLLVFRHKKPFCLPITFCPSTSFQLVATCRLSVTFCCFGLVGVWYNSLSWSRRLVSTAQLALSLGRTLYHCLSGAGMGLGQIAFLFFETISRVLLFICIPGSHAEIMLRISACFLFMLAALWLLIRLGLGWHSLCVFQKFLQAKGSSNGAVPYLSLRYADASEQGRQYSITFFFYVCDVRLALCGNIIYL